MHLWDYGVISDVEPGLEGWGWWGLSPEVASCDTPPLFQSHFLKTMAIVQAVSPARTRSRSPANVRVAAEIQMQSNSA